MKTENIVLDDMPENAHKKIHNVSFTFVALIVGVVLFFISQSIFALFVVDDEERDEMFGTDTTVAEVMLDKDLGHDYCGTLYIWLTVENNYGSVDNYKAAYNATDLSMKTPMGIANDIMITAAPILLFVCIFIAFRRADKKRFFCQNGWRLLMTAGIAVLIQGVWSVIRQLYLLNAEQPYVTGIFVNRRYYCQVYQLFGIPALSIIIKAVQL